MNQQVQPSGASDFDFFIGHWTVAHRRLKERLANCDEWVEFEGVTSTTKILGGMGNVDDNVLQLPEGAYNAVTLRTYDPTALTWSIWWLDGRHPGRLDVPMVGRFDNGTGLFLAQDTFEGKPVLVRFLWTVPAADEPRWEQAFSADNGATWETNWVMQFRRNR